MLSTLPFMIPAIRLIALKPDSSESGNSKIFFPSIADQSLLETPPDPPAHATQAMLVVPLSIMRAACAFFGPSQINTCDAAASSLSPYIGLGAGGNPSSQRAGIDPRFPHVQQRGSLRPVSGLMYRAS